MKVRFFIMAILLIAGLLTSLFSTNKLTRFCLYTPLKVLLISLALAVVLWLVSGVIFSDADVKLYMDVNNKSLFFYPFFICFSYCVASYSIFFCKIISVRKSFLLSFVCFIFLPLLIGFCVVSPQIQSVEYYVQTAYYSLAFVVPQIYSFIYFWKQNKKGVWES